MPRNNSGSYTTPAGQPVTSGTTISAATHNALVGDLATELTDSLSRSGKGGMSAPIRTPDGNAAAPAHSFTSETGTGVFRKGAANPAMAVTGSEKQEWTATGTAITGNAAVSGTLGVTGNTTLGGTLGVTGAATVGGSLGVTGAAALSDALEVDGTLTASGADVVLDRSGDQSITKTGTGDLWVGTGGAQAARIKTNGLARVVVDASGDVTASGNLTVQGATGVTLTAGNVALTAAANQAVNKSGGQLFVGTDDNNLMALKTNGTNRWTVLAAGDLYSNGGTVVNLPGPTNATDAATKGYVDTAVAAATTGATSFASGWADINSRTRLTKHGGLVLLNLEAQFSTGGTQTVATLPAGYRPITQVWCVAVNVTTFDTFWARVATTGVVTIGRGSFTNGDVWAVSLAFSTT